MTMFPRCALALFFAFVLLVNGARAEPAAPAGTTYYVSSTAGDDSAQGTSEVAPWRTLERASAHNYAPGDRLLLRSGERFIGQLRIRSSGGPGKPFRIGCYGDGARPVIDGGSVPGGGYSAAILIRNQHHIDLADLEVTNTVDRARPGERADWSAAVHVINDGGGVLKHFRIQRLLIRDVFAAEIDHTSEGAFNRVVVSGIRFSAAPGNGRAGPSFFRDVVIADNLITRTGRFGVQMGHAGDGSGDNDAHSRDPETGFNRDIVIRDNRFEDLGGSAVQLGGARFALIENNDFIRVGSSAVPGRMVGRGSGAWVINSRDIVAQHNRSHHVRGYKDSYGMHVDFGNRDVLYQYNLSHDSEGGFVEILGNNRNVIWRYNISVNDGLREKDGNTIWLSPWSPGMIKSEGIHIYHNTVYVRAGLYPDLDFRAKGARVWNNVFLVSPHAMIGEQFRTELDGGRLELAGNLFSGRINRRLRDLDLRAVTGDPLFAEPGAIDPRGYVPDPASPVVAAGVSYEHPPFPAAGKGIFAHVSAVPLVDYFGQPIPQGPAPTIGAARIPVRRQDQPPRAALNALTIAEASRAIASIGLPGVNSAPPIPNPVAPAAR